ncbi:OB-fold protein [Entomohabitans teleogrylli]|uniref:OB-fold protein n=1 Tax=Entomohabitans teleogrylli TaxID=1384589 RepID=UPI00073DA1F4|nr:hypothetical protein [Entomohabitans teleogrylli]
MNKFKLISILLVFSIVGNAQAYTPKSMDVFNNVVDAIISDDITGFVSNDNAMLTRGVSSINASKIISVYHNNEMAGDKQFKGKPVRIKTIASAIKTDFSGDAYIVANGRNSYESVMLKIDKDDDRNLKINKGNKVDFVCFGGGMIMNTPVLNSCMYPKDFADMVYGNVRNKIMNISHKNYKPSSVLEARIAYIYISLENRIQDHCLGSAKECISYIKKLAEKPDEIKKDDFSDEQIKKMKEIKGVIESDKNLPFAPTKPVESTRLKKLLG